MTLIFLPIEEYEARARREGWWREVGFEEELGDFYEPDATPIGDVEPETDEEFIRRPRVRR